ncbi:MAG: large-conductance mechanosensitive channel protein MscL [Allobaculum sp.]
MKKFLGEFKEFISRGNVMDMAVGIIIGSAFTAIVTSLVNDIIMPIVSMICAGVNITELSVTVGTAELKYGAFLQAIVNFLIIALVVFTMIKTLNAASKRAAALVKKQEEEKPEEEPEPDPQLVLLEEIRDLLKKDVKE